MEVEVRILDARLREWGFPHYGSELAAGLDLFACLNEPVRLVASGAPVLISTGFSLRIGGSEWCGLVVPRSGLAHHKGLVLSNCVGVVDPDYEGPCLVSAWNRNPVADTATDDRSIVVNVGDRIAQLLFVRIDRPTFRFVDEHISPTHRGEGGFGSTGTSFDPRSR